jgi:ATP-dependent DNA helicase HFM1/MER3
MVAGLSLIPSFLAAHTVVIHGTKQWAGSWVEYNDLDIIQMIGRAVSHPSQYLEKSSAYHGSRHTSYRDVRNSVFCLILTHSHCTSDLSRFNVDKEGVAIILCESTLEAKYNSLISGQTILESCLHQNLIEHFTSEICLGTISDIRTAKTWLRNSFLFQRLQRNPSHYSSLGDKTMEETWQERLDQLVTNSILTLNKAELISMQDNSRTDDGSSFSITDYGEIMTRVRCFCILLNS